MAVKLAQVPSGRAAMIRRHRIQDRCSAQERKLRANTVIIRHLCLRDGCDDDPTSVAGPPGSMMR